ncbi:hypothetical protein ACFFOV_17095 [Cerasicoccus arenae]
MDVKLTLLIFHFYLITSLNCSVELEITFYQLWMLRIDCFANFISAFHVEKVALSVLLFDGVAAVGFGSNWRNFRFAPGEVIWQVGGHVAQSPYC